VLLFKPQTVGDTVIADFIVPGLTEGPELDEAYMRLSQMVGLAAGGKNLIIDLTRVKFISSSALSLLIRLKQAVDMREGEFIVCGLAKQVRQVFKLVGLERTLNLQETRDAALASLGVTAN
jgi:anti-anti-sigma factor